MRRSRCHRRLRIRIVLIALAMLWSQFALAIHPGCLMAPAPAPDEGATHAHADCSGQAPSADAPMCAAHCDQEQASPDSARVPPVHPLPGLPEPPSTLAFATRTGPVVVARTQAATAPPCSWHRPTAHPAALLLI
jgi:hypothetical protein